MIAGQEFGYSFDNIGNRTQTLSGGDQNGGNQRSSSYIANNLNQYTQRTVPNYVDVIGVAIATNTLTVNGINPYRRIEYFRAELSVTNQNNPVWQNVQVNMNGSSAANGNLLIAPQTNSFTYDLDGNQTSGGLWTNIWNGENYLVSIASISTVPDAAKQKVDFTYDWQGRRIQKIVSTWNGSTYVPQSTNKFVYDGWNLVAILNPDSSLLTSFQWGTDLSGSIQGAGGVGGLISMTVYSETNAGTYFYCFDGNGNVVALVNAANGTIAAQYEYGPFGEPIRATGPLAKLNPFLFSTKFYDWETGLYYYGYRYYDPITGRWPDRDPLGEQGGFNLYAFARNNPITKVDPLGLYNWGTPGPFLTTTETQPVNGHTVTRHTPGKWFYKLPGDGDPCCEKPAYHQMTRTDSVGNYFLGGSINMSVSLSFTGGSYKNLILLWDTCYLHDDTVGIRVQCNNSTTCGLPVWLYIDQLAEVYVTFAQISYLSCEGGKWKTKLDSAGRIYRGSITGWKW
ncbi:MAG: RHS repeat-associated core domain-containing protein [Verrucomicrobiota bacterium]|jgi:RHS repeat-associated protein